MNFTPHYLPSASTRSLPLPHRLLSAQSCPSDSHKGFTTPEAETTLVGSPGAQNPYNLLILEKPEENLSIGETLADTTYAFFRDGLLTAEQVSHLNRLFRQTICCDLEYCIRAARGAAPGIYASPSSSSEFWASGSSSGKRHSGHAGKRAATAASLGASCSSLNLWKLREGKCISFKKEDAHTRVVLASATLSTRGLVLPCRRPLFLYDVNEQQGTPKRKKRVT